MGESGAFEPSSVKIGQSVKAVQMLKDKVGKEREGFKRDKCVICYPMVETLPVNRFQPNLVGRCRSVPNLVTPANFGFSRSMGLVYMEV